MYTSFPSSIIPTHILVCILFTPLSLLLFRTFLHLFMLQLAKQKVLHAACVRMHRMSTQCIGNNVQRDTRPSPFLHATLKRWEWPGNEAMAMMMLLPFPMSVPGLGGGLVPPGDPIRYS